MPDINFVYTPATGVALNPEGFNRNLYSQTAGESLMETLNGHVEYENLASTFKIQPHLVRPGQAGIARSDGRVFSADYFSDLWAGNNTEGYVPIGGACISFRVPYNMSLAVLSASVFVTQWRQFGPPNGAFGTRLDAPNIYLQTFFGNNEGIVATRRELAQTVFFNSASFDPLAEISTVEARTCHHYNLLHYKIAGKSSPNDGLEKGYGTFGMAVYIPQNLAGQDQGNALNGMTLQLNGSSTAAAEAYYAAIHRVRVYARNVTVMGLL